MFVLTIAGRCLHFRARQETMLGKADERTRVLHAWRDSVEAQMPTPKVNFDLERETERLKSTNRYCYAWMYANDKHLSNG